MSHFISFTLLPPRCFSLKKRQTRQKEVFVYMAALVYHVIANEVENRIFRHNPIFRHRSMYKQPILTKQWNHNIFVEILYSCLRDTERLLGVYFSLLAVIFPIDTGRKLNVHKTFRIRLGRLLNVLCTFSLRPVSTELLKLHQKPRRRN